MTSRILRDVNIPAPARGAIADARINRVVAHFPDYATPRKVLRRTEAPRR